MYINQMVNKFWRGGKYRRTPDELGTNSFKRISFYIFYAVIGSVFVGLLLYLSGFKYTLFSIIDFFSFCYFFAFFVGNRYIRAFYIAPLIIIVSQVLSVSVSGNYVVPLTLLNAGEFYALGLETLLRIIFLFFVLLVTGALLVVKARGLNLKSYVKFIFIVASILTLAYNHAQSPILNSINCLSKVFNQLTFGTDSVKRYVAQKKYFKEYVYSKDNIKGRNAELVKQYSLKGKNVIVFFIEGFNYNNLSRVNNFENLTPNIDELAESSLSFKNYYNHTAATFRGLRGQLTSSYQFIGGYYGEKGIGIAQISGDKIRSRYKNTLYSMSDILKKHNYDSYFVLPHSEKSNLATMFQTLGFNKVIGCEYSSECDVKSPVEVRHLSDKSLFLSLKNMLLKLNKGKNFFIGFYNLGTHIGQNSPDEKYSKNIPILNAIYNFDYQFGKFYSWFKESEYYDNTAIIITADHSAFPSKERVTEFGQNSIYEGIFVNKIPFIITFKDYVFSEIDVKGKNSIDFAPTVLNLLDINSGENYFLGCSLFEECDKKFEYYESIGESFYNTENNSLKTISKNDVYKKRILNFFHLSDSSN